MESVMIHGKQWFDKSAGVTYFSARVMVDGKEVARLPFQQGYGSQYVYEAQKALTSLNLIPDNARPLWTLRDNLGIAIYEVLEADLSKREVVGWGKEWEKVA